MINNCFRYQTGFNQGGQMKAQILIVVLVLFAAGLIRGQTSGKTPPRKPVANQPEIMQQVRELEDTFRNALLEGMSAWWPQHLDEHYSGINADAQIADKKRAIQLYSSG